MRAEERYIPPVLRGVMRAAPTFPSFNDVRARHKTSGSAWQHGTYLSSRARVGARECGWLRRASRREPSDAGI